MSHVESLELPTYITTGRGLLKWWLWVIGRAEVDKCECVRDCSECGTFEAVHGWGGEQKRYGGTWEVVKFLWC